MKFKIHYFIILILFFLSCFKSKEQKIIDTEKAEELLKQADALFIKNNYNKALELYLQVNKLDYQEPLLNYKIAFSYDKGPQNIKKAEKFYLLSLKNLNVQKHLKYVAASYFNLGIISGKFKDTEKKMDYLNSSYALLQKMVNMGGMDGEDYFRLGYYYLDKKEDEQAQNNFLLAIKDFKKNNPRHFYYAGAYFNIGLIYWQKDDIHTALWYWRRALAIEPKNEMYQTWVKKAVQIRQASQN